MVDTNVIGLILSPFAAPSTLFASLYDPLDCELFVHHQCMRTVKEVAKTSDKDLHHCIWEAGLSKFF